jgi:hypothetical protein
MRPALEVAGIELLNDKLDSECLTLSGCSRRSPLACGIWLARSIFATVS